MTKENRESLEIALGFPAILLAWGVAIWVFVSVAGQFFDLVTLTK